MRIVFRNDATLVCSILLYCTGADELTPVVFAGPLVNGSGVYLWVDQLTHVAYMKHNIILRGNQTGASQFVSQLSQNYTTVVKTVRKPADVLL